MTEDQEIALQEYRLEQQLSVRTSDEVKQLSKTSPVFWFFGENVPIQALITTEAEFIDFMNKCGVKKSYGTNTLVWIVDDEFGIFDKYLYFRNPSEDDEDFYRTPTVSIVGYSCEYNQYYDKPFRINPIEVLVFSTETEIGVHPHILEKLPAVVTFVSQDSFDRAGDVVMCDFRIHSLSQLTNTATVP